MRFLKPNCAQPSLDAYKVCHSFEFEPSAAAHKHYLITGAAKGIGRALTLILAKAGAHLILLDKDTPALEQLAEQISTCGHAEPLITGYDLTQMDTDTAAQFADALAKEYGHLDGLFHLASMLGELTPLNQYPEYLWRQVMRVNLESPWMVTQAMMPLLRQAKHPQVTFTTCQSGIEHQAYWGAYAMSKSGLIGLTQMWSEESKRTTQIRFNVVDPGPVATALRQTAFPAEDPTTIACPENCLNPFLYLISDNHDLKLSGAILSN